MDRKNKGFTLAELLIVVAIIGVLVAIAIPVFNSQLEKSRQAVDLTNMRNAKTAAISDWVNNGMPSDYSKMYDASNGTMVESAPSGYGKSSKNVSEFYTVMENASGQPKAESPSYLTVSVSDTGAVTMKWGNSGAGYAGKNITSADQWKSMTQEQRVQLDTTLLDSLQEQLQSMTYQDIKDYFYNSDGSLKNPKTIMEHWGNSTCFTLATSTITKDGTVITGGKNEIFATDLFKNAGYNTDLPDSSTYLVTSRPWYDNVKIKLDLGVNLTSLSEAQLSQKASSAFAYVNGGQGNGSNVLDHNYRQSQLSS